MPRVFSSLFLKLDGDLRQILEFGCKRMADEGLFILDHFFYGAFLYNIVGFDNSERGVKFGGENAIFDAADLAIVQLECVVAQYSRIVHQTHAKSQLGRNQVAIGSKQGGMIFFKSGQNPLIKRQELGLHEIVNVTQ
mgnify:CR=1 FL=1